MILHEHPVFFTMLIIFSLSFIIQLAYYLYFYLAPVLFRHPETKNTIEPVSVIICARNEEDNLRDFLPSVLEQDYPDYEVIVVNDCSDDDSYNILGEMLKKYPHLKVSNITRDPKFTHNKKFAQFIGIKAAKNEIMLFTDADCRPETNKWLEIMVSRFGENINFVLGYGGYLSKPGLLNFYIRYDCMFIAMQFLGMAIKGIPYMGVGRNLAYRRSLFFDRRGFGSHANLASGDDDLFVNDNATRENCTVEFRKESHTRSVPSAGLSDFFRQKKRHMTTAKYYKPAHKLLLLSEPASRIIFYLLFIVLISNLVLWPVLVVLFGIRLVAQLVIHGLNQKKFNEKGLLPLIPIFDILSPFINSGIYFSSVRQGTGKNRWN